METIDTIALMLGTAWASGINLYAAVFMLGYLASTGQVALPPELVLLSDPMVMGVAAFMYCVEFFADKTPGVDTGWDAIHTFIRIPAGAVLAAGMASGLEMGQAAEFAALLVGGGLAATSHATKAGTRILINASPEPVTNWSASIAEDLAVIGGLWTALNHPVLFIALLVVFILVITWALPRIWRAIAALFRRVGAWLRGRSAQRGEATAPERTRKEILQALYHDANEKPQQPSP